MRLPPLKNLITASLAAGLGLAGSASLAEDASQSSLQAQAPYRGYLEAHAGVSEPPQLLGGPVEASVSQSEGGVFVILPSIRQLDPDVFGTPMFPRAYGGTPGINGVPPKARKLDDGKYTEMKQPTPFGNKYVTMGEARLQLQARDVTAVDAATTEDELTMKASWKDKQGNVYEVRCCKKLASHGIEFPTFGGVVTNHILHGSSRIGTALMPTEYTDLAFWGMGAVLKNGEVLDAPRLVHGMLTEYVRKEGYELAMDSEVTPTRKHFHLMVAPMMPNPKEGTFVHDNVNTGFELPNGKTLPFWHVMFESLQIDS